MESLDAEPQDTQAQDTQLQDADMLSIAATKNICGAKHTRGICRRSAGWGTDHAGVGRCKKHDIMGSSMRRSLSESTPTIKALAKAFRQDKDPFELREEIAQCRAVVASIFERVDDEQADVVRVAPAINQLLNTIGKLVQRLHEIEEGRRYVIHVDQVRWSLQQISALVVEYVPDARARAEIAERVASLGIVGAEPATTPTELTAMDAEVINTTQQALKAP